MAVDQIVEMVIVWNRFMSAIRTVDMIGVVSVAIMACRAGSRVRCGCADRVFFNRAVFELMVEVPIVQIIDVSIVLDGGVSASGAMLMVMAGVC